MLSSDSLFIAIDAGTTNIKTALIDINGQIVDIEKSDINIISDFKGFCEMDMNDVWNTVCQNICSLNKRNKDVWNKVAVIGVCGQGDGIWPIDKNGCAVGNAILWNDTRKSSLEEVDIEEINEYCIQKNTTALFSGAAPILLRWLKYNDIENYNKIYSVLHCKDWINYKLTGNICTDYTDASTALLNLYTKKYEYSILDMLDIYESKSLFPDVLPSTSVIGNISENISKMFCIDENVAVIAGAIDVLSSAAGCNIFKSGQKGSIIGTTLCNYIAVDQNEAKSSMDNIGSVLCHISDGLYIRLMAALSGTPPIDWLKKEIFGGEDFGSIEQKIEKIPVGCDGIIFHPYIYGERAPFSNPYASAGFFGIRSKHTKYHIARAVYEGAALSIYDCYKSLPKGNKGIYLAGGGAKSNFLCQAVSDCMGENVYRCRQNELGILGIYNIICRSFDIKHSQPQNEFDTFTPNYNNNKKYMESYNNYYKLRKALEPIWNNLQ